MSIKKRPSFCFHPPKNNLAPPQSQLTIMKGHKKIDKSEARDIPLVDDHDDLSLSLADVVRPFLGRFNFTQPIFDDLKVIALLSLPHNDGPVEVALGKDQFFELKIHLFEDLLMVRFALNCSPGADFLGHLGEDLIMVSQQLALHYKIVFPQKFNVFELFRLAPVPPSEFDPLPGRTQRLHLPAKGRPNTKRSRCRLGFHQEFVDCCYLLIYQLSSLASHALKHHLTPHPAATLIKRYNKNQ